MRHTPVLNREHFQKSSTINIREFAISFGDIQGQTRGSTIKLIFGSGFS
jgi:hypothetical protein